ncbi:hypothetical protein GQ53DRAFT_601899, partial [Thozetella sp. PMI_491]
MRLINVSSLEIEKYFGHQIPAYAILSHCWGAEEVTHQEWTTQKSQPASDQKLGARKVIEACSRARIDGIQYLWCDTVCIDKLS